jgi:hypothetical protein
VLRLAPMEPNSRAEGVLDVPGQAVEDALSSRLRVSSQLHGGVQDEAASRHRLVVPGQPSPGARLSRTSSICRCPAHCAQRSPGSESGEATTRRQATKTRRRA